MRTALRSLLLLIAASFALRAFAAPPTADRLTAIAPFRIADNLYYVGSRDLASYLITTPTGDILINSNYESSVPQIHQSIEQLGFKWTDIKILLISHSHDDHDAGSSAILKDTHAKYMVMDGDVDVVQSGGRTDFAYGPKQQYPETHVDRVLHDGDKVTLGGVTLVAHKTPGHTKGCTTWTMRVHVPGEPAGTVRNVVIVGSWNVNAGFRLVASHGKPASYPTIVEDYEHTFTVLKSLPCDVFLGSHGQYFDMLSKLPKVQQQGEKVWIDPNGYKAHVSEREHAFETELAKQKAEAAS